MNAKPVILVIDNSTGVTGAIKSIIQTSLANREDFDFHFVIPSHSKAKQYISESGFKDVHELPMKELSKSLSSLVLYVPHLFLNSIRLSRLLKRSHVSVIHVNDIYNLLPVVVHFFGNRIPYVCHIRFLPDRFPKRLFNFWYTLQSRYARRIIAVSEATRSLLPDAAAQVVYDNLPERERYPEEMQEKTFAFAFVYIANFVAGKGQDYALEAFSKIHERLPEWKLRFVGGVLGGLTKNMVYKDNLKKLALTLGIEDKIEWGELTLDVEKEYKLASIVLNFSESESFSMTCLESLFFGRPTIATNCGGPAEIIDHGITGILVENKNVVAMSTAMEKLASDEKLRRQMGSNARAEVRKKFSRENTSGQIKSIYNNLLG